ncbi:double-strand break repair protein AddB [Sphingopyxis macrogoltabida]|uniref:Double-strand break repair protein AddB n=1 Tax=Sphingopyxis macrogoltabida TaxID=33050 RepID=A0AAC9AWP7_SPHMC|nr:double-strand break repair protein AddB [Sphingopyxis macrogoltabida]ALJ14920.1 helicase [Sphingopyxis macrogoltabida]AMU91171.1 double-strand break repair protein AddB [Sphingopyxis macrogoltabida]
MVDAKPDVFSIPVHRAFADALVAGLIARFADGALGLAEGLILLPSNRAKSAVQAAFVRAGGAGLLMPRLAVIGDADLDESIGIALDAIDAAEPIAPAIDTLRRRLLLADLIERHTPTGEAPIRGAAAFQLADGLARAIDQLHYEEVPVSALVDLDLGAFAGHWQASLARLRILVDHWPAVLAATGHIDRAARRNRLLERVTAAWRTAPPAPFVIAAGITTAAPAIARLLRTVADLERGMVVLPGVDCGMAAAEWDALGPTRLDPGDPARPIETHPQYHLKLLLDRMGVAREEVLAWDAGSDFDGPAARAAFVSLLFAPADFTGQWQTAGDLSAATAGIAGAVFADDGQEAQGIALLMREAVETPGRTAALVTPDRGLAERVAAALSRWDINVDDSAGQPLSRTPPGALLLLLAELAAGFDPVALIALLGHPLVRKGEGRTAWLDQVRRLDLVLREPGLAPGWDGVSARIAARAADPKARGHALAAELAPWWDELSALGAALAPFAAGPTPPATLLAALQDALEWLSGDAVWTGPAGRTLAELFDQWTLARGDGPALVDPAEFPAMLEQLLTQASVRPPYGGHPRLFIWGLLEARLQRADLMILGGLDEGRWPAATQPDPWLAPGIRRLLGLPAPERHQGMAAHDFAGALGAREIVVTRAARSGGDPVVASRFWLRLSALAGDLPEPAPGGVPLTRLAAMLDVPPGDARPATRPAPRPPADARPRRISVTGVDRLARDPFAFYADRMLGLSALDPLSAAPDPRWRGTRVHKLFEDWVRGGATRDGFEAELAALGADPALDEIARAFWLPRIEPALRWAAAQVWNAEGRAPLAVEASGEIVVDGLTLHGKADRIDRTDSGALAIVDYKSGGAPSAKAAFDKLDSQLGLLGLIAQRGGIKDIAAASVDALEYWSLRPDRRAGGAGKISNTYGSRSDLKSAEQAIDHASDALAELAALYLFGDAPFVPGDMRGYGDYDQLMRRDEWFGRGEAD